MAIMTEESDIRARQAYISSFEDLEMRKVAINGFEHGFTQARKSYKWIFNDDFTIGYYEPIERHGFDTFLIRKVSEQKWAVIVMFEANQYHYEVVHGMDKAMKTLVNLFNEVRKING